MRIIEEFRRTFRFWRGEAPLATQVFIRLILTCFAVGVALSHPVGSHAQAIPLSQCTLVTEKKADLVGPNSAQSDGKPDLIFALGFSPQASGPIAEIQIHAAQPQGLWSTRGKGAPAGFLAVTTSKAPGKAINKPGGALRINPRTQPHVLLFASDDGKGSEPDRSYTVKIIKSDGTSWMTPVNVERTAAQTGSQSSGVYPVRMTAYLKGISNFDAVNPGRDIRGDDKADGLFGLTVESKNKVITGIEIRSVEGVESRWNTVPGAAGGAIGVALASKPAVLLNNRDGSVKIPVKDRVDLNLYVADSNDSIAGGKTTYRVALTFEDGEISWCPVQRAPAATETPGREASPPQRPRVNFLGKWMGYAATDAVGPYPEMKPDGKADAVFGLDIEVSPKSDITGIEIQSLDGISKKWGTGGTTPGDWGMGVAYQTSPKALMNKPDGSVRIPIGERTQFFLYVADPGDLSSTNQALRLVVHFADGKAYQQYIQRPTAATSTVVPGSGETPKARGIITCEFRGFIADLVNTSTRPRKDGYFDGTFIMKLQVENKHVARIDIRDTSGAVRWSSDPKTPVMFLGVAQYPNIFKLINPNAGALNVPVSGRRTLYLYGADNGLLSDPNTRLSVTVTFTDKTTLSAEVIK